VNLGLYPCVRLSEWMVVLGLKWVERRLYKSRCEMDDICLDVGRRKLPLVEKGSIDIEVHNRQDEHAEPQYLILLINNLSFDKGRKALKSHRSSTERCTYFRSKYLVPSICNMSANGGTLLRLTRSNI
jgi:hypothetical protein